MKIIKKYILKEFLTIFFLTLLTLISVYLLIDFFERIGDLVKHHAPLSSIFQFFLFKLPFIIYTVAPFAVLFSTILSLGFLSRHMEIVAMRASGISYLSIVKPVLLSSLLIAVFTFSINESIAPKTNRRVRELKERWIRGKVQDSIFRQHKVWLKGKEGFFNITLIEPKEEVLKGFTLFQIGKDFSVSSRIDARTASWEEGRWNLKDAAITNFSNDGSIKITNYSEKSITLSKEFKDFQEMERNADEIGFMELWRYIDRLKMDGYEVVRYTVDLYSKLSLPFGAFVMAIIGIPFAMRRAEKGGALVGIGLSLILVFAFWIVTGITKAFGYGGVLPPFLAAWTPNLTFSILGMLMYTYIE
ncbi:MAG: LPS export ABC transporter permease LptG [Thermodesulfobacteriota bacterium]